MDVLKGEKEMPKENDQIIKELIEKAEQIKKDNVKDVWFSRKVVNKRRGEIQQLL